MIKNKLILICLLLLVGCSQGHPKANMSFYDNIQEEHSFFELKPGTLIDSLEKKKSGIYLLGFHENKTTQSYVELLDNLSKEKELDIHVLDLSDDKLSDLELDSFKKINSTSFMNKGIEGVLPLIYVVNNEVIDIIAPVSNGISLSGRYLRLDEKEETKLVLDQLTSNFK